MKSPTLPMLLARRLEPIIEADRTVRGFKYLAAACLAGVTALALWHSLPATQPGWGLILAAYAGFILVAAGGAWLVLRREMDVRRLVKEVESEHPELQAALLTALEVPGQDGVSRYLHERVVKDVVRHGITHDWMGNRRRRELALWKSVGMMAVLALMGMQVLCLLPRSQARPSLVEEKALEQAKPVVGPLEVEVRPGDVEIERGTRLVVEARFNGGVPESVDAVLTADREGGAERQRVPMRAGVESTAFGGVLTRIDEDGFYKVTFGSGSSKAFKITTYVHPALVQSDAVITPPAYTGQPVKEVKKTQTVTALEGSRIKFRIRVNKPVAQAELYGEDKQSIPLVATRDDPLLLEGVMEPVATQRYRLHLVDAQERSNKQPPWFKVSILADQPPKVEVVFPKRDLVVSPIQEVPLEAKVWDDLGVQKAGAVFMLGDETREVPLTPGGLEGRKNHELKTMMELETLKAEPRQLLSYYVWAEDHTRGGTARRTQSDMFFAEVRHFEDIFREGESPGGGEGQQQGGGSPATRLGKLQKEVVNATWKVAREAGKGRSFEQLSNDMGVLKESQDLARQQAQEAVGETDDAEIKAALEDALKAMTEASGVLEKGITEKNLQANTDALRPERRALEALHRAQSREHRVMRNQQASSSGASSQSQERQLMQLELKQQDKRYEEEKAAGQEQTAEQQENLQVLARLKELARRQEALAEKIKDLENQLQQARTDDQREELQQQLKRLQEEQEELLKDLDELKERMDQPENQATMAEQKEQLDEAREQAREAAEQLAQQQTGGAASAATKAKENLEKVRDQFREKTSRQFAEEMKQLKEQAAALASSQQALGEELTEGATKPGPEPGKDLAEELERRLQETQAARKVDAQREALGQLLEQMRKLSEQSEASEPLLSDALHDAMRKAHASGIDEALAEARALSQFGRNADAQAEERKAARGVEELKQSVDRAAESVLGSETESLRMARAELDRLLDAAKKDLGEQLPGESEPAAEGRQAGSQRGGQTRRPGEQDPGRKSLAGQSGREQSAGEEATSQGSGKSRETDAEKSLTENKDGQSVNERDAPAPGSEASGGREPGKEAEGQRGQMAAGNLGRQEDGEAEQPGGNSPGQRAGEPAVSATAQAGAQGQSGGGAGQMSGREPQGWQQASAADQGQGRASNPQGGRSGRAPSGGGESSAGGSSSGGGDGGWFFDDAAVATQEGTITGSGYEEWADRLRRVEEALTAPELRQQAARVQDNARNLRFDARRNDLPPQSDQVQMQIIQPLAELRDRVMEELSKKEASNPLAPLDRDPVPHRFREQVRRYYTELGTGK